MIRGNIFKNWKKDVWIASKSGSIVDENYYEVATYDEPVKYRMNIQPTNASSDLEAFGETSFGMLRAIVPYSKFKGKIKEFDVAYVGVTPDGELENGANANYRVKSVAEQNLAITIYFEKITK